MDRLRRDHDYSDGALLDMAAILRTNGAVVRLPMDLLEVGAWARAARIPNRVEREWKGTTVIAAAAQQCRISRVRCGRCMGCRRCVEECACDTGYRWEVFPYGGRCQNSLNGVAESLQQAQQEADEVLRALMEQCRARRQGGNVVPDYVPAGIISVMEVSGSPREPG